MKIYKKRNKIPDNIKKKLSDANIFYTEDYSRFEERRGNRCIYACDKRGIILVVVWKKLVFKWGCLPSEPFYFEEDVDEAQFLDDMIAHISSKVYWIAQSDATANFSAYPSKSRRIFFGNYIVDLTKNEEELFKKVTSKARNMIRRARRDGVEIVRGKEELIDEYLLVDGETWKRSGISKDARALYYNYIVSLKEYSDIYIARKDGRTQGGAIFIKNKTMSYYMYGASVSHPVPGAMNLLQWTAMMDFKAEGVKKHNFVGCRINEDKDSKYHGIQKFKASFGGELIQGFMFKLVINNIMYKLFQMAVKLKKNSQSNGDIIDQEIHKWSKINA